MRVVITKLNLIRRIIGPCLFLAMAGCTYPFASISNRKIMPKNFGETWEPPKRARKVIKTINAPITVDPKIFDGEISLSESINFALTNNPNTSISWAQVQSSIAKLGLARADSMPTFEFIMDVIRTRRGFTFPPDTLINQWLTSWGPQLNITYTLWDFGTRAKQSESALQALFAMAWSYNQEIQNLVRTITNDYYENLFQKATLANDFQNTQDALLILESAERKLQVGVGDITQLVQAKTNYLQSEVDFINQKDSTAASLIQLATDMGMPGNVELKTQSFPTDLPDRAFSESLDDLIAVAIEARPDILQSKAMVKSKKADLNRARLDSLPKIDGSVNLNYRSYNDFYARHLDYTGQIQLNFPFFQGFYYRNRIREAKAEYKKSIAELKKQQEMIMQQVSTYYVNYNNAVDRVDASASFLDSALEEFDVTLSNFRAGTGDIIDVMQAQTSLSDARTKYTESVRDLFVSLTNLAYATGSLVAPQIGSNWDSIYTFEESNYESH